MQLSRHNFFPIFALFALAFSLQGRAETAPSGSPFLPTNAPATGPHSNSNEPFQLSAIGVVEGKTFVSIYDAAEKRSRWIVVGGSLGDLKIVSCDVDAEQAVVRIGGQLKTLTLPKPAVTAGAAPAPDSTVSTAATGMTADQPAAVATPATEEEQAREARMLVSDLLEIGMQQRKAYEDAQKKTAEQADKPPAVN